ncbi:MAG: hypothetical protein RLZ59_1865 [Pseudomonadota bacterium]
MHRFVRKDPLGRDGRTLYCTLYQPLPNIMTRLFLYLIALVAGFSPAQASRAAWAEPVAIGQLAQPVRHIASVAPAKAHLVAGFVQPWPLAARGAEAQATPQTSFAGVAASIELTDRPRA